MRDRIVKGLGFLVLWGLVGFATGTATLMGPVRWITNLVRWLGTSQQVEGMVVNGIIVAFVLGSFLVAWLLGRWIMESDSPWVRFGVPSVVTVAAAGCLWLWLTPGMMTRAGPPPREPEAPFTIGPYPDEHRMRQLRAAGYTGVISLLHPAVVPFEPRLLSDEREAAAEVGLEFIHAPMLPWVSSNQEALETVRAVARRDTAGYYYIHCYLGRDRVRVVARTLREMGVQVDDWEGDDDREEYSFNRKDSLQRGPVHALPDSIFVVPFPNREEYFSHVLNGGIESVVSVLDPSDSDERAMIDREEGWLEGYGLDIDYRHFPLPLFPTDPCRLQAVVDSIRSLPRPVAVHGASTHYTRSSMVLRALQSAPVYPEDFALGDVTYAGDSIYVGPAPVADEISDYLVTGGLASVASLLDPSDASEAEDLERIREALEEEGDVAFASIPLPDEVEADDPRVAAAADRIMTLPRPVYVHADRSPEERTRAITQALRAAGVEASCGLPAAGAEGDR
jgi:protein tyrosine phosphatase (PTP) superfamily phosphohydrolase (DUF442 family)